MASKERQILRWNKILQPEFENLTCFICNTCEKYDKFKKYYAEDIFNAGILIRHECPNCSLIFGDLRFLNFTDVEIANDHEDTYSYFTEGDTTGSQLDSLNSLEIFKNKNLKYLDYACGTGKFVSLLKTKEYNITGYDKYVTGENVLNNLDNLKFDIIFSNNFIEHLINPIKQINEILNYLNDDGYLIFISDCIDEYMIEFTHFHTFFYTGKSFELLCNKLNLNIVESKKIGPCKVKVLSKNIDIKI
jgi:SAM-dependent methyltransferase